MMIDYNGSSLRRSKADSVSKQSDGCSDYPPASNVGIIANSNRSKVSGSDDNDDVFTDSEGEENGTSKSRQTHATSGARSAATGHVSNASAKKISNMSRRTDQLSLRSGEEPTQITASTVTNSDGTGKPGSSFKTTPNMDSAGASDIKAIAADASVFSFGDEEDFESD